MYDWGEGGKTRKKKVKTFNPKNGDNSTFYDAMLWSNSIKLETFMYLEQILTSVASGVNFLGDTKFKNVFVFYKKRSKRLQIL